MRPLILLTLTLLALGCEQRTSVNLVIPPTARRAIARIELRAHAPANACSDLDVWAVRTCGEECGERPPDVPDASEAIGVTELRPDPGGSFSGPELPLGMDRDDWDVIVIGYSPEDEPIVFGCEFVEAGDQIEIPLVYPLCAAHASCAAHSG